MGTVFPSIHFFTQLQDAMNANPDASAHLAPSDAYCGICIGTHVFVLEFDGRECSAVVPGGNELDLDFVVAGEESAWQELLTTREEPGPAGRLCDFVDRGLLELRSADESMLPAARETLPFLDVYFSRASGLELDFN